MEIPDVELVVEGAAEADANEVGGEEGRNDLYAVVKAKGRFRSRRAKVFWSDSPLALPFLDAYL